MHELALTNSILNIALTEAEKHGAERVLVIRLKVGELAGVMSALIQQYFNIVSADTAAAGARLIIEKVPAVIACRDCGAEREAEGYKMSCPACGSGQIQLISGREFYVDSLEAE